MKSRPDSKDEHAAAVEVDDIEIFESAAHVSDSMPDTAGHVSGANKLSLQEAMLHYGVSERTIRRRIKTGKLEIDKDSRGKTLVIVPDTAGHPPDTAGHLPVTAGHLPDNSPGVSTDHVLMAQLLSKVEALTYRNGYLEAQLAERERNIKLLEDRSRVPWWRRTWAWFLGR